MKCHLCINYIEMQTDPANCDYVIVSGARRKEERWDMAENEQILTTGTVFSLLGETFSCNTANIPLWKCLCPVFSSICFLFINSPSSLFHRAGREGETGNRCHVQAWPWGERQRKTQEGSAFSNRHYWVSIPLEGRLPTQQLPPQKVQGRAFLLWILHVFYMTWTLNLSLTKIMSYSSFSVSKSFLVYLDLVCLYVIVWLNCFYCRQRRRFWQIRRRRTGQCWRGPTCPSNCCLRRRRTRSWQLCSHIRQQTVSVYVLPTQNNHTKENAIFNSALSHTYLHTSPLSGDLNIEKQNISLCFSSD